MEEASAEQEQRRNVSGGASGGAAVPLLLTRWLEQLGAQAGF